MFIGYMQKNVWKKQFTVFFNNYSDSLNIIEHMKGVKRKLRNDFSDSAILYRVCLKRIRASDGLIEDMGNHTSVVMPYFTFFTSEKIKSVEIEDCVSRTLKIAFRVKSRAISRERLEQYISSVKTQKSHDLKKYLAKENVNRIGLINRDKLLPVANLSNSYDYNGAISPKKIIGLPK
tara:strand:+ start:378 stop:908 length:531 start_codon:yes stop_codon:yes gene_type:complete